jgi:hypothetical protein
VPMPIMTSTNSKNGMTLIVQLTGVIGTRPCRSSDALRTQSPPLPRQLQPNFSLEKNVAASGNARRDSRTRHS